MTNAGDPRHPDSSPGPHEPHDDLAPDQGGLESGVDQPSTAPEALRPGPAAGPAPRAAAPIGNPLHERGLVPPRKGLGGLLESRPVRKYRKNKPAMAALVAIVAFLSLGLWVFATDTVNDLTGGSLSDRPLLGLFLRERTLQRVGPDEVAGFNAEQDPARRLQQYDFMLNRAAAALAGIERLTPDSPRTPEDILAEAALGERRLGPRDAEGLRALVRQGRERFAALDRVKLAEVALREIERAHENLLRFEEDLAELLEGSPSEDELLLAREELALSLDNMIAALGEFQALAADDPTPSELALFDPAPISASVDALFDLPGPDETEPYDRAAVGELLSLVQAAREDLREEIPAAVAAVRPVIEELYPAPEGLEGKIYAFKMLLGTDRQGRSIVVRAIYSAKIAIQVGLVTGVIACLIGAVLGAAAGYFGGWIDNVIIWVYSTLSSIPYIVLLVVLAFAFQALPPIGGVSVTETLVPLYFAFGLTYWIGPCRVIRGEAMKLKGLDYIQAAQSIGVSRAGILLKHIIPNTVHLVLINFSLLFIAAIKGEVILTFLGLGLKNGASWGIMIDQSKDQVVNGFFWQIGAATAFMFVLVLAFNIFTDALQDAFDPKHVG